MEGRWLLTLAAEGRRSSDGEGVPEGGDGCQRRGEGRGRVCGDARREDAETELTGGLLVRLLVRLRTLPDEHDEVRRLSVVLMSEWEEEEQRGNRSGGGQRMLATIVLIAGSSVSYCSPTAQPSRQLSEL